MYYLIVLDGRPVGMIQTYLVSDYREWEEVVGPVEGLAGVDLLIGEEDATGRGLAGPGAVHAGSRLRPPGNLRVRGHGREPNRRSWRAFENAGFAHVRDVEKDGLPHRLMRLERRYAQ